MSMTLQKILNSIKMYSKQEKKRILKNNNKFEINRFETLEEGQEAK
jgi:hypothetical protein